MDKLRAAIIGCGRISSKHIEALVNNSDKINLVALCDRTISKAINNKEFYLGKIRQDNNINIYRDYKKMLENEKIDMVAICTESGYHAEISIYCMNKGVHVICEKPMALSISDADEMIETSKRNKVKLCINHQNRFNPPIQKLRKAVELNKFNKIINGTARILWNRGNDYYNQAIWRGTWEYDGGTLMNQCIHNIDLLQWMLGGEAEVVYAQCNNFIRPIEAEDFGAVIIKFKNGAIGVVEGTACVYPKNLEETLSVFGETGTVCIGGLAVNKIETWEFKEDIMNDNKELSEENIENVYGSGHTPLYKDFEEAIRLDREPSINGEEGKKAVEIILAAYKASLTGLPVQLPLDNFSTLMMKEKIVRSS